MKARDYQREAIDAAIEKAHPGKPQLIVLPTGSGKSFVGRQIAEHYADKGPVLLCMHREELIQQWEADFLSAGWAVFVEQAERRARMVEVATSAHEMGQKTILIASMQTMRDGKRSRRLSKWNRPDIFALCMIDEAHRSLAPSYRHIMKHFSAVPWNGLTATPQRQGLANVWDIAYQRTLYELMHGDDGGWLTPLKWRFPVMKNWDWSDLKPRKGKDITQEELDSYFDGEQGRERLGPLQRAIRVYLHEEPGQALIYMPTAKTAKLIAAWLNTPMSSEDQLVQARVWRSEGMPDGEIREKLSYVATPVNAASVTATTEKETRSLSMRRFRNGTLRVMANYGVFTEGINVDDIQHVIMVRPTALEGLYLQMIGRGARLHSSIKHLVGECATAYERKALIAASPKPFCRILQFVPQKCGAIDFMGPHQLMWDVLPELDKQAIRELNVENMTLAEMEYLAQEAERERLEREQAAQEAAEHEKLLEYKAREKRSPWLVMQGDIAVKCEDVDLIQGGAKLLTYTDLQLTWKQYEAQGRRACPSASEFSKAKKAQVEFWHRRAQNADRELFRERTGVPRELNGRRFEAHWARWKASRMEKKPRYRAPAQQTDFDKSRERMARKFHEYLLHSGTPEERADSAARGLFLLSTAWTGTGINNEFHYWWTAIDPSHVNPAAEYARPWGKRRRK